MVLWYTSVTRGIYISQSVYIYQKLHKNILIMIRWTMKLRTKRQQKHKIFYIKSVITWLHWMEVKYVLIRLPMVVKKLCASFNQKYQNEVILFSNVMIDNLFLTCKRITKVYEKKMRVYFYKERKHYALRACNDFI